MKDKYYFILNKSYNLDTHVHTRTREIRKQRDTRVDPAVETSGIILYNYWMIIISWNLEEGNVEKSAARNSLQDTAYDILKTQQ